MDSRLKLVTRIPVQELERTDGTLISSRKCPLSADEVIALLRNGEVEFVVANVGLPLHWIAPAGSFAFWKTEGRFHLFEPGCGKSLSEFPGHFAYFASEWNPGESEIPVVLLEKHH
jgi:hypothetical protein